MFAITSGEALATALPDVFAALTVSGYRLGRYAAAGPSYEPERAF